MAMFKLFALGATTLAGLALAVLQPPPPPDDGPPPPPKAKKDQGPGSELRKAYDLLRRVKADGRVTGRPEERLRDWTDRAAKLYRDGVAAFGKDEMRQADEYGIAAHDLARAIELTRNAAIYDGRDDDLPPPPDSGGPGGEATRTRRDLRHAYDRISGLKDHADDPDAKFYLSARRDAEAGRHERAGELARAAEALTHVPEHLAHLAHGGPEPPDRDGYGPEPKSKPQPKRKGDRPEPKGGRDDTLPPPL
jgi:hypothetical protein